VRRPCCRRFRAGVRRSQSGAAGMRTASNGDTVRVHYMGTLQDGTVVDSAREREPLEFPLGEGQLIPGCEAAVLGMTPDQQKTVEILADDAYGPYHEEMVQQIERAHIPEDVELVIGRQLLVQRSGGQPLVLTVIDLDDELVTVDANHPLAGQD